MIRQAPLKLTVLLVAALCSAGASAGLGPISVRSNLGETFRADIPLSGVAAAEFDSVRVGLAGNETFRDLGVDYPATLSSLRFSLVRGASGAVVRVTSVKPVRDPFLRFVVEARGGTTRSVREYTVLLDPPEYRVRGGQDLALDDELPARPRAAPAERAVATATPAGLLVTPGSTLYSLAARVQPPGASLDQTRAALLKLNPDAFIGGDPDRLRAGARLKVPSAARIRALSAAETRRLLAGGEPAPVPASPGGASFVPAAQGVSPPPAAAPVPATPALVAPVAAASAGAAQAQPVLADEALGQLEAQVAERDKSLKAAEARIAALEAKLRTLQQDAPPPAPAAAEGGGWLDAIVARLPLIGGVAAGALLLALAGLGLARRRRARQVADAGLVSPGLAGGASTVTSPVLRGATTAGAPSFMSDFTRSFGEIDAGEVDPVAEAEVYIAYGRDQQAEEILKDALARDPARHEVRLKLLEIYAAREDRESFEPVARELHLAFDGRGQQWAKAAAMGQLLDPENPLYHSGEVLATQPPDAAESFGPIDLDQELMAVAQAAPPPPSVPAATEAAPTAAEEVADPLRAALFGEDDVQPGAASSGPAPDALLDFDLDALVAAPAAETAPPAAEGKVDDKLLDFDFQLDDAPPAKAPDAAPQQDDALGDFAALFQDDAPTSMSGVSAGDDPLSTKLDLARVYLDMGDSEGAREVLTELAGEASGPLKDEAESLLAKITP
ncbi:pilus assembly protein FimV [Crenobacter luteus]|nr:pilus assembly protein FimV [Crenobacter luteus]